MWDLNDEGLKLVYVNPIGKNSSDWYEYDFYFSRTPDIVWGYDWDCDFAAHGEVSPPDASTYETIKRLKTIIPFQCIQNNNNYGMRYATDDIISICFEDISDYEEYPDDRIVFHFGEDYDSVENKLGLRHQLFYDPNDSSTFPENMETKKPSAKTLDNLKEFETTNTSKKKIKDVHGYDDTYEVDEIEPNFDDIDTDDDFDDENPNDEDFNPDDVDIPF